MPALVLGVAPGLLGEPRGLGALPGAFLAGQPLLLGLGQGAGASPPRSDCLVRAAADAPGRCGCRSARGAPGPGTAPPERGGPGCAPGLPPPSLPEPLGAARSPAPRRGGCGIGLGQLRQGRQTKLFPLPKQKGSDWQDGAQLSPRALPPAAFPRLPRTAGFPGQCPSRPSAVPLAGEATPRPEDLGSPHSTGMLGLGAWSEAGAGVQFSERSVRFPPSVIGCIAARASGRTRAGLAEQFVRKPRSAGGREREGSA